MKSRASIKFCSLHAESHSEFQSIAQCAKMRKVSEDSSSSSCGETASSEEVSNMLQNKVLTKFRGEEDLRQSAEKGINKKISWSQNLIQVQIQFDWRHQRSCSAEEQ